MTATFLAKGILGCKNYPGSSVWPQCNHKCPYKREAGGERGKQCDDRNKTLTLVALKIAKVPARTVFLEAGKGKEDSPLEPPGGTCLC